MKEKYEEVYTIGWTDNDCEECGQMSDYRRVVRSVDGFKVFHNNDYIIFNTLESLIEEIFGGKEVEIRREM